MKNKILLISILMVAFVFAANAYAAGKNSDKGTGNQIQQQTQTNNQGEDSQIQVQNNEQIKSGNETSNQVQNQNQEENQGKDKQIKNKEQEGQINAEEHRSAVANFVQTLLKAASTTEGGIGQQVRVIAQQQNDSNATTTKAIETIQSRSKIKTFLIGSDYKNLGALRSEIVQTRNRIDQLNRTIQNTTSTAEIQAQIQTLEREQTKIESFIKAQEGKFSLFGWLVKLFNK